MFVFVCFGGMAGRAENPCHPESPIARFQDLGGETFPPRACIGFWECGAGSDPCCRRERGFQLHPGFSCTSLRLVPASLLPVLVFLHPGTDTFISIRVLQGLSALSSLIPFKNKTKKYSFIDVSCTSHTIHPLKLYNSVVFSIFTEVYIHHHSQF